MAKRQISAGILVYRFNQNDSIIEVFLVKPGGPYSTQQTNWGIPKGHVEKYDNKIIDTALREFKEEVGYEVKIPKKELLSLGDVKQNKNKTIHIWAYELDLGDDFVVHSNLTTIEYPKNSNTYIDVPEISEGKYFTIEEAKKLIIPGQCPMLYRLLLALQPIPPDKTIK